MKRETYIIKKEDTFNIKIEGKQMYFEALKVDIGLIDAIKLTTTQALQKQKIFVFKSNDATVFID